MASRVPKPTEPLPSEPMVATPQYVRDYGIPRLGRYLCQRCQKQFSYSGGQFKCPHCGATADDELVAFYTEEDPETDELLGPQEFPGGD
ncbi:MAG TPA: hypothetical protein V6D17_12290 [Candidatus Obscuribacterales bacterium]